MTEIKNIYCIGRNYVEHIHELGNVVPDEPLIFSKPTHAIVKASHQNIDLPQNRGDIHYETEIVLKMGKDYTPDMTVDELVSEMTIGLDLTLRDLQSKLKAKGQPWLLAKGFKHSAVIGEWIPFVGEQKCQEEEFKLFINKEVRQVGNSAMMIFSFEQMIRYIAENLGLKKGDIIFTGTPKGVGPLKDGDHLAFTWADKQLGACTIEMK